MERKRVGILKTILFSVTPLFAVILLAEAFGNIFYFVRYKEVGFPLNRLTLYKSYKKTHTTLYKIPFDDKRFKCRPGSYITSDGIKYTINSFGFRGKEFDPYAKKGLRIICFGGSSTLGLLSPHDKTYPVLLETRLNRKGIDAEVLNFGQGSKSLNYIRKLLFNEAINYSPDIITIYSNRNTALYDSSSWVHKGRAKEIDYTRLELNLLRIHNFLIEESMSYRLLYSINGYFRRPLFEKYVEFKINSDYFLNGFLNTIKEIIEFARNNGVRVVLIKQPLLLIPELQLSLRGSSIAQLLDMLKDGEFGIYDSRYTYENQNDMTKFWILTSTILNKQLDSVRNEYHEIVVVDPLDRFLGKNVNKSELFYDYVHLTPKGNELLSEEILKTMEQEGLLNKHQ